MRLRSPAASPSLPSVDELVAVLQPEGPLVCVRPDSLAATAASFVADFPGRVLYAVKCNPEPAVLRALWAGGVRHFDCASMAEIELVRGLLPDAGIHFMHPVKSRQAIARTAALGVRTFVLDTADELAKIEAETGDAADLALVVRLALPRGGALCDLSGKFGAMPDAAAALLRAARPRAATLGVSFHVGSQCLDPLAWRSAIEATGEVIRTAGVRVDMLDVGGGFPAPYARVEPAPRGAFFAAIEAAVEALDMPGLALWAEPGRALVATGVSTVVRVDLRRGDALYVNDGIFGGLSDAGPAIGLCYPARLLRVSAAPTAAFRLWGPTCDSADVMPGPWDLPADVREGDRIEVLHTGAYGGALATRFNGFGTAQLTEVR